MIRCGISTPQTVTLTGTNFPSVARVLVTFPDGATAVEVTPATTSSTVITFSFIFAICGTYTFVVTDATGDCDDCASDPITLTPTADPCQTLADTLTLAELRTMTLHQLGDDAGSIWTKAEVADNLTEGYQIIATQIPVFWDQLYAENLPRGFSVTQPWELLLLDASGNFDYGVGNFTAEFERLAGASINFDSRRRLGPANHTSPFEIDLLDNVSASTAIPATVDLPKTLTRLDRASWDTRGIDALEPRTYSRLDARYETTQGEVLGYMWQKDGVRTFRKVRVPSAQCDTYSITGSWGLLRTPSDLSSTTPTGTWGIARVIEGQHPLGETFGFPRRPYQDGKNVRIEHFRQGRLFTSDEHVCELPQRYARYLIDYAMSACLSRPGPGYDKDLAAHFEQRWQRGLERIRRRVVLVNTEDQRILGADGATFGSRPPRPSLPAAYGQVVR